MPRRVKSSSLGSAKRKGNKISAARSDDGLDSPSAIAKEVSGLKAVGMVWLFVFMLERRAGK